MKEDGAMARSDTRYSVYPDPKAVEVVGDSAPALNQAIECWASLLATATTDNSKAFYWNEQGVLVGHTGKWEHVHSLRAWGFLAQALKGTQFSTQYPNPGELLASS